ncbi:MAG: DUF4426 domain-containing protein [Agarilytica sp.]
MKRSTIFLLSVLHFVLLSSAQAQTVEKLKTETEFGDYIVRHVVFNSTFVLPEVSKSYQIKRSKYESLLNVAVSKKGEIGSIPAKVSGTTKNLIQQQKQLNFKEISEKDATYYIAPIRVANEELLHFTVHVTPENSDEAFVVNFSLTVYADD